MKTLYNIILFGALAMLCSCSGEINNLDNGAGVYDEACRIVAYTETPDSKTSVVDGGTTVYWNVEDEIKVFSGEKSAKFISGNTELATSSDFIGPKGFSFAEDGDIVAVYPYSEDAAYDGETITMTLPSEQVACPGTFARGMNISVALSSHPDALHFYNVCGGVRFSVTEEGINKVIFEGLGGEIISGKITVAFEDGLPVVQSVSNGSPFITLQAPDGEAFEVGKWYYISALSGTLEKGYKLRFYKSDTYAKHISEKSVNIKRSIFGSISEADKAAEYSSLALRFPKTIDELRKSVEITDETRKVVGPLIDAYMSNSNYSDEDIISQIKAVENVIDASFNEKHSTIYVMQKDSICINYIIDLSNYSFDTLQNYLPAKSYNAPLPQNYSSNTSSYNANSNKRALILAPFFTHPTHSVNSDIESYYNYLIYAGFSRDNIDILVDKQVSLSHFQGEFLDNYDVIIIRTHGGITCTSYSSSGRQHLLSDHSSSLSTSVPWSKELVESMVNSGSFSWDRIVLVGMGDDIYLGVTPKYLENASFNQSIVVLGACHSLEISNDDEYGEGTSMVEAFKKHGAGFVAGYTDTINSYVSDHMVSSLLNLISHGISIERGSIYLRLSSAMDLCCSSLKDVLSPYYTSEELSSINNRLFNYWSSSGASYLVDNEINLGIPEGGEAEYLSWECNLSDFEIETDEFIGVISSPPSSLQDLDFISHTTDFKVHYDVYIDGVKCGGRLCPDNSTIENIPQLSQGEHKWYVEAFLMDGNTVIDGFKSEVGSFTISSPIPSTPGEAIDLGLPSGLKWASCNLGASKPEEYGGYYQWGGTTDVTDTSIYIDWDNCPYHTGSSNSTGWTKYVMSGKSSYWSGPGNPDNKTVLDPEDDVAHVKWGGSWRIPTEAEFKELRVNCTSEWTTLNGVNGRKFTSKKNGNSIFLPAAGYRIPDSLYGAGDCSNYWSSSLHTGGLGYPYSAFCLYFQSDFVSSNNNNRLVGQSVRPVYGDIVKATSISMDKATISLETGKTEQLTASLIPADCAEKGLVWSIDNPSVATVSDSGLVTALSAGTAVITVSWAGDSSIKATCTVTVSAPAVPEMVDLGLPSGLKWASCNLGASKPEEYGGYYQWGGLQDVTDTSIYLDDSNCPYHTGYSYYTGWTKYIPSSKSTYWSGAGSPDNKTVLDPEDDVAHVKWGGSWRMPTKAEWDELRNTSNCTWTWTTVNGIKGYKVTSKKSGYTSNYIFLPAAGYRYYDYLTDVGSYGYYWSSSLGTDDPSNAYSLFFYFYSGDVGTYYDSRCSGLSVRPVSE